MLVFCLQLMDLLSSILCTSSFPRCGSTHVLRSSLTLILRLKTYQGQQEWKWCLRPWSGIYKIPVVWICVSAVTFLHKYSFTFCISSLQRYDGWGRKSVCGLLFASRRNTSQAQEGLRRGDGLHAWRSVSTNITSRKLWSFFYGI